MMASEHKKIPLKRVTRLRKLQIRPSWMHWLKSFRKHQVKHIYASTEARGWFVGGKQAGFPARFLKRNQQMDIDLKDNQWTAGIEIRAVVQIFWTQNLRVMMKEKTCEYRRSR